MAQLSTLGGATNVTMKQKLLILFVVGAVIVIGLVVSSSLRTQPMVSLSTVQVATNGVMQPPLAESTRADETWMKVTFYVTNNASRAVALQVAAVERKSDLWIADTQALPAHHYSELGQVEANGATECSFVLPYETVPTRLRVLVSLEATTHQKALFAFRRFWANIRGRGSYKQLWFHDLFIPTYQVTTSEFQ